MTPRDVWISRPLLVVANLLIVVTTSLPGQLAAAGSAVFSSGFEEGGPCAWSRIAPSLDCPPIFPGIVLMVPTDLDEITLAWLPATDDTTGAGQISYDVHLSESPEFEPGPGTWVASLIGETQYVATDLFSATKYYALILAEDLDGHTSYEREYRSVSTPKQPPIPNASTPWEVAEELFLGVPTSVANSTLVFLKTAESVPPTVGALLLGHFADGGAYARSVDSVTVDTSDINVGTSPGSLGDAFDQHHLPSTAVIQDVEIIAESIEANASMSGSGLDATIWTGPQGNRHSRLTWPNGLLQIEKTSYELRSEGISVTPMKEPGDYLVKLTTKDFGDVTLEIEVEFEPELVSDADWSLISGVQTAELAAIGTLSVDASARYEFSSSASLSPDPWTLFKTTWRADYVVPPGVPVVQDITLELIAEFTATATASITAEATASASVTVEAGVTYDESTGWDPYFDSELDPALSADLDVMGSVQSELRLIPKISVEFYEVITGRISVEPSINGLIQAETTTIPLCSPAQLTDFDFALELDCFAGVDFSPFSWAYTLFEAQICNPDPWTLFNLPEFNMSSSGTGPVDLEVQVIDGVLNPYEPTSAEWDVSPSSGSIDPTSSDPPAATLACTASDTYSVAFSGYGWLGPPAKKCVEASVPCSPGGIVFEGDVSLRQTWSFDIEEPTLGDTCNWNTNPACDMWFEAVTATERYLKPVNGAHSSLEGSTSPGFDGCSVAAVDTQPIDVDLLQPGTFLCYHSNGGHTSEIEVIEAAGPAPGVLVLHLTIWEE